MIIPNTRENYQERQHCNGLNTRASSNILSCTSVQLKKKCLTLLCHAFVQSFTRKK